jgi:Tfp pilus assembly PilM family ATPase
MAMFLSGKNARTGIHLETASIKLARGEGRWRVERFTHLGVEEIKRPEQGRDPAAAAAALARLLARLGLKKRNLGRIAVSIGGAETTCRQVVMPPLTEEEIARALPFEARKHLDLEGMESPVVDFQVMGPAGDSTAGPEQQQLVLFAAAPKAVRNYPLDTLRQAGLEPDVVDLEALAGLNALISSRPEQIENDGTAGLLYLGSDRSALHLWNRSGGLLSREIGGGIPANDSGHSGIDISRQLAPSARETLTFFQSRSRRNLDRLFLSGNGAALPGVSENLSAALEIQVEVLDPLGNLAAEARPRESVTLVPARFATACGLCRWWDRGH